MLIPAAGQGRRAGGPENKVLAPLAGVPVVVRTCRVFQRHPGIRQVVVIAARQDREALERLFGEVPEGRHKLTPWVEGGAERQDSVRRGLEALDAEPPDWVLVHDAARPLVSPQLIDRVLAALEREPAVVPVLPLHDTVREMGPGRSRVVERSHLVRTQTPQGFHWHLFREAHARAAQRGTRGTDDAQLIEALGASVARVEGEPRNIKLTTSADFPLGAWMLDHPDWGR